MATPSPHLWAFFSPHEGPPPYVPAPADAGAADRILLLARHAMDNGPSFFDMVRSNQAGNPAFAFLTQPPAASSEAGFFRWALWSAGCGLPPHQPPPQGYVPPPAVVVVQQQQQPVMQVPQQQQYMQQPQLQQQYLQQHQQPPLLQQAPMMHHQQPQQARPTPPPTPPEVAGGFSQVLDGLSGSKESIKASQSWFMACAAYAPGLAFMMASKAAGAPAHDPDKILHLIYLANDILFKAVQQQQQAGSGQQQQQQQQGDAAAVVGAFVPAAGVMLAAAQAAAQASGKAEVSEKVTRMLSFWRDKAVFDGPTIARLQHDMAGANAHALLLAHYPPPGGHHQHQQLQQLQPPGGGWGPPLPQHHAGAPSPHQQQQQPGLAPPPAWQQQQQQPAVAISPGGWGPPQQQQQAHFQPQPQQLQPPQPQQSGWGPPQQQPGAAGHTPPGGAAAPWGAAHPAAAAAAAAAAVAAAQAAAAAQAGLGGPPAAAPPPFPGGAVPPQQPQQQQPVPDPVSSFSFPPGLIPQLSRDKSKYADAYAPLEGRDIEAAGLPPPPDKDAYLKSRLDKFLLELRDYRPGSSRADLEEGRAAAREKQGLEPDSDEELALGSTGSRLARRKALGMGASGFDGRRRRAAQRAAFGPVVDGMAEDGSYVGPGGGRGERLGLGAHASSDSASGLGDVYSTYRRMRSTSYHQMIAGSGPPPPQGGGG